VLTRRPTRCSTFTKPLEDQTVEEEATATLECEVSRDNAEVCWFRDGQEIHKSKKYEMLVDGRKRTLLIHRCDCTLADEGEYTVVAGDDKSTAELIISEAPADFAMHLKDQTVTEFEDAEFSCKLTKAKVEVKWYRDGREIREGPRFNIYTTPGHSTLTVSKTKRDDSSTYIVEATNTCGRATATVDVNILVKVSSRLRQTRCVELIIFAFNLLRVFFFFSQTPPAPLTSWNLQTSPKTR
uniref:Ig-like domain-containing protein n=1 Tax=Hippocampus comes TaxID=109280 RepID=A0A3Q2Z2T7_HIPCM